MVAIMGNCILKAVCVEYSVAYSKVQSEVIHIPIAAQHTQSAIRPFSPRVLLL